MPSVQYMQLLQRPVFFLLKNCDLDASSRAIREFLMENWYIDSVRQILVEPT
jgi:hypothetical protein